MEKEKLVDIWFVFRILSELQRFYLCNLYFVLASWKFYICS